MTADLRKLAEAATPGPWRFATNGFDRYVVGGPVVMDETMHDDDVEWGTPVFGGEPCEGAVDEDDPNVRYVCAASPDAVLALLDRAERAERERDEERHLATVRGEMLTALERERDAMDTTISTICLVDLDPYDGYRMPLVGPTTRENVVSRVATLEAAYREHSQALADVREALLDAFPDADGSRVATLAQVIRDLTDQRDEARAALELRPEISHIEAAAFVAWCEAFDKSVLLQRETRDAKYALTELRTHAAKAKVTT